MKWILDRESEKTFFTEGKVELGAIYSEEDHSSLFAHLKEKAAHLTESFSQKEPLFRKIKGASLIQMALKLSQREALRIGFATLLKGDLHDKGSFTLEDSSFASDPVLGLLITLEKCTDENSFPVASTNGGAFFFTPTEEISFPPHGQSKKAQFLLIVFCMPRTRYVKPKKCIFEEPPKTQGYGYGDSLEDSLHPLFHRTL